MNQGPEEETCKDYDMNELQKAIEKYEHESFRAQRSCEDQVPRMVKGACDNFK